MPDSGQNPFTKPLTNSFGNSSSHSSVFSPNRMKQEPYVMDRILHILFHGAFALIRVPLMMLLMASIVVSLIRNRTGQLVPVRVRRTR